VKKIARELCIHLAALAPQMLVREAFMPKKTSKSLPLHNAAKPVRIGFVPVADCAPLLVAQERDLFRKHGVRVDLSCEAGWATIREKLLYAQVDAAHAIAGLALAMRLGLSTPPCQVIAPFVFNLHGNAITLSRDLWNRGVRDAVSLRKMIRSSSRRFTFGVVSRYSSHNFLMRRFLLAGGIDPDRDARIVALPPTQMESSLAAGLIDGFCVGEPWNSAAVARGSGWIAATSQEMAPLHPEKILLMVEEFAHQHPDQAAAVIAALHEACALCDEPEFRPELARLLDASGYFAGCEPLLKRSLIGPLDLGTGQVADAASCYIFHRHQANQPTAERGRWLLNEFLNHRLLTADQRNLAEEALRSCWKPLPSTFPAPDTAAAKITNPSKRTTPVLV
jgi:NitT/TauT family transport system ATP-binding protein